MVSSANIFGEESRTVIPGQQNQSVQGWKKKNFARPATQTVPDSARAGIAGKLTQAAQPQKSFESAMAYTSKKPDAAATAPRDDYSFSDILDIINPLQHIPVVNYIYRGITGDTIKPTSQVFGGAIYGGPVGLVSAAVNFAVQHETGADIAGNVVSLLTGSSNSSTAKAIDKDNPVMNLNAAAQKAEQKEISAAALPFVNLAEPRTAHRSAEVSGYNYPKKNFAAKPRTDHVSYQQETSIESYNNLPAREAVSSVSLSPMPPKRIP